MIRFLICIIPKLFEDNGFSWENSENELKCYIFPPFLCKFLGNLTLSEKSRTMECTLKEFPTWNVRVCVCACVCVRACACTCVCMNDVHKGEQSVKCTLCRFEAKLSP